MQFEITVSLKKEVLDPEARAIQETLNRLGMQAVRGVSIAKRYVLDVDDDTPNAAALAESVAHEYLANPVAETFSVRKL